jgi:putative ABC transport system permease protein
LTHLGMNKFSISQIALSSLKKNRARTLLTVLGIVIGITSVVVVVSAGQGIKGYITAEVEAFGSDYIEIEVKVPAVAQSSFENALGQAQGITITTLTHEDGEAIANLPNIERLYSGVLGQANTVYRNESKQAQLFGVTEQFIEVDASEIDQGRFFTQQEDRTVARVVVLGSGIKSDLFGDSEAVGEKIKIGRNSYIVIGVLKSRGTSLFFDWDQLALVPLSTLQKQIMGIDHISFMVATMKDVSIQESTKADVEDLLRARHNITDPVRDDFAVVTQAETQEILDGVLTGVSILLIAIAAISLIVGGVGIMNIMYVSVTERTYEIGLRKSVGARREDILWQFLWEAIIITLLGGLIGIALGVLLAWAINFGAKFAGLTWDFVVPWWGVVMAFGFSTVIGLVFGYYPARRAAKLNPITALHQE